MAWRMALPPEKQAEQEAFDDALLEKAGIDMETEADLLRYEAKGGSVLTHVFAVHDVRTRYRIHQKWHRGCPRLYGPARTLLYLDDLRDYFGEKVAFYFAFMDHYTRWLAYASAPALVVLIVQVVPFQNLCDQDCTAEARLVTGVDNIMVIPSCVGIAIWAVRATATRYSLLTAHHCHRITHHSSPSTSQAFFLATWKRKSSTLAFRWDVQVTGRPSEPHTPHIPHILHILTPPSLPPGRPGLQRGGADPRGVPSEGDGGGAVEEGLLQGGLPSRTAHRPPLATNQPLTTHRPPLTTSPLRWAPASCRSASGTRRTSRAPSASAASGRR